MVGADLQYVRELMNKSSITGPVLELGTGYGGSTCKDLIQSAGMHYYGTDLFEASTVDFVADFERTDQLQALRGVGGFGTILILNVLEHCFEPIKILDNAASLLLPNGRLVVLTPAIWPLHNYPMDAYRLLPNFYEEYAKRRTLTLEATGFEYVGFGNVESFRNDDKSYAFPPPQTPRSRHNYSRSIHKLFNTCGRAMFFPSHVAVAAVLQKQE